MPKNKKVIFNTWNAAFFHPGGGEIQLLNSKKYLEKCGFEIDFYNAWNPQKETDIFHQFSIQNGVEQVMSAYKDLGKKIALSTIFWAEMDSSNPYFTFIKNRLEMADILMTNSDAESVKLAKIFDVSIHKFHKTRNSITEDYFNTKTNSDFKKQFNLDQNFILSVANIEPRKNLHCLLMAAEKLKIPIISIGHIKDKEYFKTFLSHSKYFKSLGPISDVNLLKSAYQQCLIFAMPSICETPGIAAIEAASQGSKIVITSEGSTQEYFLNGVTYVNPFSPEDIENGIQKELDTKRGSDLKQFVLSEFKWDLTAQDIKLGYDKMYQGDLR